MEKNKKIEIRVKDCKTKPLDYFQNFQGELKKISQDNLKRLKKSITGGGFTAPLFIWKDKILDGHQRKIALESLRYDGYEVPEIPYVEIEAENEIEAKKILLTFVSQYAEVNKFGLEDLLRSVGMSAIDALEFAAVPYLEDLTATEITNDDISALEELPAKAKPGQLYELGPHRLLCGDATNVEDIRRLMKEEQADMCFTDPPYNIDYTGNVRDTIENTVRQGIQNDKMSKEDFVNFLQKVCRNVVLFTRGSIYICMSPKELGNLKSAFELAGGHWHATIIWVKQHFTLSGGDYKNQYEPILYGWPKDLKNHFFIDLNDNTNVWEDVRKVNTEFDGSHTIIKFHGFELRLKGRVEGQLKHKKQATDIWRYDKPSKSKEHPTMKPLELCAEAIKNSSQVDDIVLDLFGGSFSTMAAAHKLKRRCYAMELDPKYIDVGLKRMLAIDSTLPLSLNGQIIDKKPWL